MNLEGFPAKPAPWLSGDGPMKNVVISSRIRLARNLNGYNFLSKASPGQRREIYRAGCDALVETDFGDEASFIDMELITDVDRQMLVERNLISRQHADAEGSRGLVVASDEAAAVMINEEDHLRLQALGSGLCLDQLWNDIDDLDDAIGRQLEYAFDKRFGFLTACPTNVGTGIRVSVMLHLPALKLIEQLDKAFRAAKELRLAVRGLYGEGTEAIGDFYQISNQTTLGKGEDEILSEFGGRIIPRIVDYETRARQALAEDRGSQLDDKIWRAYGLLQNARMISTDESLFHLSYLRLGVQMNRFSEVSLDTINDVFLRCQPAHLQKLAGTALDSEQRAIARADFLRRRMNPN
jgi:protein arginine kinase